MSQPYYYTVYGGQDARRTGARHASISPYGPVRCRGGQVFLGLQNEREWAVLCERVLGRPDLVADERFATNPDRVAHDDELTAIIEAVLGIHDARRGGGPAGRGRASPAPGCARPRSSPRTRSSRPGTGGARWTPRPARSGRCSRRSACPAARRRWAPSRRWASTPTRSWPNSYQGGHHDHTGDQPGPTAVPARHRRAPGRGGVRAAVRHRRPVPRRAVGLRGRRRRRGRRPRGGGGPPGAGRAVGPAHRVRPGPADAQARRT